MRKNKTVSMLLMSSLLITPISMGLQAEEDEEGDVMQVSIFYIFFAKVVANIWKYVILNKQVISTLETI